MASTTSEFHRALGRLARTNNPPSAQDATLIREIVGGIEKNAAEVRSKLRALEATLQDLEHERQFFKPMLSPLRRMPLEVLGEIFVHAMGDRKQSMLAHICQVSKGWREAAHLVPRLWKETTIDPSVPTLAYDVVSSWIGHSGGLPRSLVVYSRECGRQDTEGRDHCRGNRCYFSKPVIAKLLKTTSNLERVNLICPTPQCFKNLVAALDLIYASPWRSIKSFVVTWSHWNCEWENIPPGTFSRLFPASIRSLHLDLPWVDNIFLDRSDLELNISPTTYKRLTTLILTCDWDAVQIFQILQYCTNLETLEVHTGGGFLEWEPQDAFVRNITRDGLVLQKLKTMWLLDVETSAMKRLKFLKMPNIAFLGIQFGDEDWAPEHLNSNDNEITPDLGTSFATFVRGPNPSQSTLQTLHIRGGVFQADTMLNALQNLSNINLLILDNVVFTNDLFANISSNNLLPKLKMLHLLRLHTNPSKLFGLDGFVKARGITLKTSRCDSVDCEGAD